MTQKEIYTIEKMITDIDKLCDTLSWDDDVIYIAKESAQKSIEVLAKTMQNKIDK